MTMYPPPLWPNYPDRGPLTRVTPFTYRDGRTFAEKLEMLSSKLSEVITCLNTNIDLLQEKFDALSKAVDDRETNFENAITTRIDQLEYNLRELVENTNSFGAAYDPTNGVNGEDINVVLNHIYDMVRIHARFAQQNDDMGMTAEQMDALANTARFNDLASHKTINENNTEEYYNGIDE